MPAHLKNEIGNTYGKLFVIRQAESRKGRSFWVCLCTCGNEKEISANALRTGSTISCGCEHRGQTPSPLTPPNILAKRRKWYESIKNLPY